VRAIVAVRAETGLRLRTVISSRAAIRRIIDRSYHASSRLAQSMAHLVAGEVTSEEMVQAPESSETMPQVDQLKLEASDPPVVQFVNLLLMRAIQERASDIHIEPEEQGVRIRLRVDGLMREVTAPPKHMLQAITTRIKLLGNLDIAERRLPQDGRFKFQVFDRTIDVRLSCLPLIYGEKLVLRILDRGSLILDLQALGFEPGMLETFQRVLQLPHGLVILTGPTGSGKTTTLYAALNTINSPTKNIMTIEDPVEYQLGKINQLHTKASIGLTFAAGLRSILRQDPDIIMVGEVRDRETAEICIRAALTGHLVLSTLHTNDAVSAVSRLTDMEIEPYLLTAALSLIMAQRLVRRICLECATPWKPAPELLKRLQRLSGDPHAGSWRLLRGAGCQRCGGSGYFSRIAIYEQFVITERIKTLVAEGAGAHHVKQAAREEGLQSLLQSALNKVREGVTTLDEALSVCATQSEVAEC
jgi:type II secretory ATPase GspE/PulE/Tfp pilus assembly ATPase PilB-like protein